MPDAVVDFGRDRVSDSVSRLRWQCRRGMRELDELLLAYLENVYPLATSAEKEAFATVLALPDPELAGYLLNRQQPDSKAIAHIIRTILSKPVA